MITALISQKGGSAKSTLTVALAWELHAQHARVLVVDADPQGTVRVTGEVAAERGQSAPSIVALGKDMYRPEQLPRLAASFEHVFIDTPGRLSDISRAALMVADLALIPVGQSAADAWGIGETIALVQQAQTFRPELKAALVITRILPRTSLGKGAREALAPAGIPIFVTETTYRIAWQEALAAGVGPVQYAPKDKAANETIALLKELLLFTNPALERKVANA